MDKHTEYIETLSAQIVEWDAQIDLLKDKSGSSMPGEESEYSRAISELQKKRDEAALTLQGIGQTSDDEWDDIKSGSGQLMGEVRTIVNDTIVKIR